MENVERVCGFLDEAGVYYLATVEGDQPRVRPFGTALVYNGRLYIQTGKIRTWTAAARDSTSTWATAWWAPFTSADTSSAAGTT